MPKGGQQPFWKTVWYWISSKSSRNVIKKLFYNIFSQIYPKYSDQIASEPFMDNCLKVASVHFKKLFDIDYHWNNLVSS